MSLLVTLRDNIEVELPTLLASLPGPFWLGAPRIVINDEQDFMRTGRLFVHIISTRIGYYYPEAHEQARFSPMSIARFSLTELPGNAEILVSHDVSVEANFRGLGLGKALCKFRMDMAQQVGYKELIATVNNENEAEQKLLTVLKWHPGLWPSLTCRYWHYRIPQAKA